MSSSFASHDDDVEDENNDDFGEKNVSNDINLVTSSSISSNSSNPMFV